MERDAEAAQRRILERKRMRAECVRGVAQRDHRKVIAGVMLPKVRRRSSKEDRTSRDAAAIPQNRGSLTVTSGSEL
jgi:hypothetical protein